MTKRTVDTISDAALTLSILPHRKLRISNQALSHLPKIKADDDSLKEIEEVQFACNFIARVDGDAFDHMRNLKVLCLGANELAEVPVEAIRHLPHLTRLHLNNNKIQRLSFAYFSSNPKLELLDLRANQIAEVSPLGAAAHLPRLRTLSLSCNKLTSLEDTPTPSHSFSVFGNHLADFQQVVRFLARAPSIQEVYVGGNPFSDYDEKLLMQTLPQLVLLDGKYVQL